MLSVNIFITLVSNNSVELIMGWYGWLVSYEGI